MPFKLLIAIPPPLTFNNGKAAIVAGPLLKGPLSDSGTQTPGLTGLRYACTARADTQNPTLSPESDRAAWKPRILQHMSHFYLKISGILENETVEILNVHFRAKKIAMSTRVFSYLGRIQSKVTSVCPKPDTELCMYYIFFYLYIPMIKFNL